MVLVVGDVDVAVPINRHPARVLEAGVGAGPISRPRRPGGASQRGDHTGRRDLTNRMVISVGDVDVAVPINRHPVRVPEAGVGAGPIIRPRRPGGASQRGDHTGRRDLTNRMVPVVGDVDVAVPINRHPDRVVEAGVGAGPISRPRRPASERGDRSDG